MTRNFERPDWAPLIDLVPERIDDFIWMFEVELEGGLRIHAYKHRETRRYLHLDHAARAYVYLWSEEVAADDDGRYREVDPEWLLRLAVDRERSAIVVRGNVLSEFKEFAGRVRRGATASRGGASALSSDALACASRSRPLVARRLTPANASSSSVTTRGGGLSR